MKDELTERLMRVLSDDESDEAMQILSILSAAAGVKALFEVFDQISFTRIVTKQWIDKSDDVSSEHLIVAFSPETLNCVAILARHSREANDPCIIGHSDARDIIRNVSKIWANGESALTVAREDPERIVEGIKRA